MITKIISGGQTGSNRGGLDAALHWDLPHGGWCPRGRKAKDGLIPAEYHLAEMLTPAYLPRTQANVIDADTTLNFTYGPLKDGSMKTGTYAHHLGNPIMMWICHAPAIRKLSRKLCTGLLEMRN